MSSMKRVYQDWKGNNHFFLGGRLIFGPDVRSFFATIALILFPVVIFCVFVARDLLHKFPDYNAGYAILVVAIAYTLFVLVLLFLTSAQDPGIVPRALNPPEEDLVECAGQTPRLRIARVKEIPYNGMTVKVKYCDTCMLYRPPRCSHCSICNNCVERFDHHCPWVGQCIGMRNYRYFFMFVSSSTFLCIFIFSMCALDVKFKTHEYQTVARALRHSAASIVLMAYSFICVWFVGGLTVFHLYLISRNQTTYENFKYRAENRINLYDLGCLSNFRGIFCTSAPPSKINLRCPAQQGPNQPTPVPLQSNDTEDQDAYVRSKVEDDLEIGRALSKVSERSFEGGDIRDRGSTHHDSGPGSFQVAFEQGIGVHPPSGGTRRHSSLGGRGDNWEISHDMLGMNSAAAQGAKSASDVSGGQNR